MIDYHPGSWDIFGYKLPDVGLTEAAANLVGRPSNNLVPNQYQDLAQGVITSFIPAASLINTNNGQVQGVSASSNLTNNSNNTKTSTQNTSNSNTSNTSWKPGNPIPTGYGVNSNGQLYNLDVNAGGGGGDPSASIRNDISSGWDSYISSLDQQLGNLPGQRSGLESQANDLFNTSKNDILSQQDLSLQDVNTDRRKATENQNKSLKDVASNISNLLRAGNIMLGTKGAADSSAANMYSYALTKLGSKERGNVMNQTQSIMSDLNDREAKVKMIAGQEVNKMQANLNTNLTNIATWFNSAQQDLLSQKGQAGLQKGQDLANLSKSLLDRATQMAMYYKQQYDSQVAGLQQWALNNSNNIASLRSNLNSISSLPINQVSANQISGAPQFDSSGNLYAPLGLGQSSSNEDYLKRLLGNNG